MARAIALPDKLPSTWVVDCKSVGDGSQALLYLGRYLVSLRQGCLISSDGFA